MNTRNKDIHYFSCSNYVKDYRGSCQHRHYVRADAIEQIVMLELKKMSACIRHNEERFAEILARKTNSDKISEEKYLKTELERLMSRNAKVERNYEKLYEDNMDDKVTDEWFMHMSRKYEEERIELRAKISKLREQQEQLNNKEKEKELFVSAVRKFMEMETLTAPLLHELIDHIDIYETEGTGKNRTQRIVIHYRFVGYIEIPSNADNYKADTRQGVAVEYLTA